MFDAAPWKKHAVYPHKHGALLPVLGAEPSVILQGGAAMVHRQIVKDVHGLVESVSGLNVR